MGEKQWADARLFDGDVKDPTSKVPWKLACYDALMDVPGLESVAPLRGRLADGGELVNDEFMSFRMYMDWCPHGDLADVIDTYETKRRNGEDERIPEALIWYVAEALADCGTAMAHGTITQEGEVDGWRKITHR